MSSAQAVLQPDSVLDRIDDIRRRVASSRHLFVFTDFDGTLSPIVETPRDAHLHERLRPLLRQLASNRNVVLAVLSGRGLDDLRARVGLPLIYAGNHGLEIAGPGFSHVVPEAEKLRFQLLALANELRVTVSSFPGALVESKRYSLSVHYRRVAPQDVAGLRACVQALTAGRDHFDLREGKQVLEVRPHIDWDKGSAARWIIERSGITGYAAVCLGDDNTDEDMFRALPNGISVRVGDSLDTCARFRLDEADVPLFFAFLLSAVSSI